MGGGCQAHQANASYPTFVGGPVPKQIHNIVRDRLRGFTGTGQYEGNNLLASVALPTKCLRSWLTIS